MPDSDAIALGNLIDTRIDELPPLLRERFERMRGRRYAELLQCDHPPGAKAIKLFSNDYLSLANHPSIVGVMLAATSDTTDSLWMSSVFFKDDSPQRRLEQRLAAFLDAEDCVLTQSGYCANFGLVQSIAAPGVSV